MVNFCLPKFAADKFLDAIEKGHIDFEALADMSSSAARRAEFAKYVGEENAHGLNANFEKTQLLQSWRNGVQRFVRDSTGFKPEVARDLISRTNRMSDILKPDDETKYYEDLTASRLGIKPVGIEEAGRIQDLAQQALKLEEPAKGTPFGSKEGIAFGRAKMAFDEYVESLKPYHMTWTDWAKQIASLPNSLLTSIFHMSALGVQGWGMMSTGAFWRGAANMFKYFANEEAYKDAMASILGSDDYAAMKAGHLGITKLGDNLSTREEAILSPLVQEASSWISKQTGLPDLVRASSRAFTGTLNFIRAQRFIEIREAGRLGGEDVSIHSQAVKDAAFVVNNFTGRGELGKNDKYANVSPVLNILIFSTRKAIATIEMFNPVRYMQLKGAARMAAIRQLSGSLIATSAILSLAAMAGAKVETNPTSTNFGKIQIGKTTFDITGGNAIYGRLIARLIANQEVTSAGHTIKLGQGYKPTTRADLVLSYTRDKLAPTAAFLADALYGSDPVGKPFSLSAEAQDKLVPIVISDFINFFQKDPGNTAALIPMLSAIVGVQVNVSK